MTVKDGTCYIIKRDGKRYNSKQYGSYEEARSYIRKKLRSNFSDPADRVYDHAFTTYNNPSISEWGFSIAKTNT